MDTSQWPQGIGVVEGGGARRARPQKDEALNCPRCNSTNTKFCYYNNYSLSQPRYFCKTCRRYWTDGGSLRNVPVGGGSRKNKRSSSSIPSSSSSIPSANSKMKLDHAPLAPPTTFLPHLASSDQNPSKIQYQGQDLNLAYPPTAADHHFISKFVIEMPQYQHGQNPNSTTSTTTTTTTSRTPAMELFKTRGLMSPFVEPTTMYPTSNNGFNPLQEMKPPGALNFTLDGLEGGGYGQEANGARLLFPFEDANSRGQGDPAVAGYWSGMLGGDGGSW